MRLLLFGVIYSEVEKFLGDYFYSIDFQTNKKFTLLIVEDNCKLPKNYYRNNLFIKKSNFGDTPADIRYFGIEYAKQHGYDIVIFTDCDDYYSKNRIEETLVALEDVDFCVSKTVSVLDKSKTISKNNAILIPDNIDISKILVSNYFGLSNTALRLNSLPDNFYIPSDIVAVDWWIYTLLILNKKKYSYADNIVTYYRQHENNLVGLKYCLNEIMLKKGIAVKLIHYKRLVEYCKMSKMSDYISLMEDLILQLECLKQKISDKDFRNHYIEVINKNINKIKTGWWSEILPLNEWRKYE
jgi:hypothetical protein